jgi:hypothetical protein
MVETQETERPDLLAEAMTLVAERGWHGLRLAELATRTGRPLDEVYERLPTPYHLLVEIGRRLDRAMLAADLHELEGMSPRERLFELVMRRFDAMEPFRPGLERLGREALLDPAAALALLGNLDRMARWALDASDARLPGVAGPLARLGLMGLYARVFRVWLRDDSPDLGRTLAELDKRLDRAERLARFACGARAARPSAAAAEG